MHNSALAQTSGESETISSVCNAEFHSGWVEMGGAGRLSRNLKKPYQY